MWRRDGSQAVCGRPKRNSVRRIHPKSADRRNLIRSIKAFCASVNANMKEKKRVCKHTGSLHSVQCYVYMSVDYGDVPMQHEEGEKRVRLYMTRWDEW